MKASRFSEAQKAFILKQGVDGVPVAAFAARPGSARRPISTGRRGLTDCYRPRAAAEATRGRDDELGRVADLSLDKEMLQEALRRKLEACPAAQARR